MNLTVPKKSYVAIKKNKVDPRPLQGRVATFYIQFIVLFKPFNLMYYSLKSDVK
jgi:hypothetical protein